MAQRPTQFCPNCGVPLQADQRFCTNCGSTIGSDGNLPTMSASYKPPEVDTSAPTYVSSGPETPRTPGTFPASQENTSYKAANWDQPPPPPPAAPAVNPYMGSSNPNVPVTNPYTGSSNPNAPTYPDYVPPNTAGPQAVPLYAQKPPRGRGGLIALVLLLVLIAGVGGFLVYNAHKNPGSTASNRNTPGNTPTSTYANTPVATSPATSTTSNANTEQLNLALVYSGVHITIVSVQEASSFPDDTGTSGQPGVVRVNVQENNASSNNANYVESNSTLLVLPDGNTLQLSNEKANGGPDAGVNRSNWLDFVLTGPVALNQLVLRFGTQSENQMNIPLKAGANLSQYADKTSSPNTTFQYAGFSWVIKTATLSYSYSGQQATTGNRYLLLSLSANNTTSNDFIASPGSYTRIQTGGDSIPPDNTATFPISIAPSATVSGVIAFPVPQDATTFTLVLLPQSGITQSSANIQIH